MGHVAQHMLKTPSAAENTCGFCGGDGTLN